MKKTFSVIALQREDIVSVMLNSETGGDETLKAKILALSDKEMEAHARTLGDMMMEGGIFWTYLERIVNDMK